MLGERPEPRFSTPLVRIPDEQIKWISLPACSFHKHVCSLLHATQGARDYEGHVRKTVLSAVAFNS